VEEGARPALRAKAVRRRTEGRARNATALSAGGDAARTVLSATGEELSMHERRKHYRAAALIGTLGVVAACSATPDTLENHRAPEAGASVLRRDGATPAPRLLWVTGQTRARGADMATAATRALAEAADALGLEATALASARLVGIDRAGGGPAIATFEQRVDGIEVFGARAAVVLRADGQAVALTSTLAARAATPAYAFSVDPARAVAAAYADVARALVDASTLGSGAPAAGGYLTFAVPPVFGAGNVLFAGAMARVKKTYVPRAEDGLIPAFYVEIALADATSTSSEAYGVVVAATDGAVLWRASLVASEAFTYRVWADPSDGTFTDPFGPLAPHPRGAPSAPGAPRRPTVPPARVTLACGPIGNGDPWLPPTATETVGNNVNAYADLTAPDGMNAGDVRPGTDAPRTFDHDLDLDRTPTRTDTARRAAVIQLFYDLNALHDAFYDAGFDEASGNPQEDNYGRGGVSGDRLRGEAQDASGRDNANALTPADGASPRIQMYVWTPEETVALRVGAPAGVAGTYAAAGASFGPASFVSAGELVATADGCTSLPLTPLLEGKIALLASGPCDAATQVLNAQGAGAIAAIVAATSDAPEPLRGEPAEAIVIGALSLGREAAGLLRGASAVTSVAAEAVRRKEELDGALDASVVAHEWGHVLSNRLVGNASGLVTNHARGLGEGWSDFVALLVGVRERDDYSGTYAVGAYAPRAYTAAHGWDAGYFGFRRAPYSTDFSKNALTLRHMADGEALPTEHPLAFGADGARNAQVHNAGEVWANALWECYAALLRDRPRLSFAEANRRMRRYLVASLKLTPVTPTVLEARDALLAVALAADERDFQQFGAAFARRGFGVGAQAPDRSSLDNRGTVESFAGGASPVASGARLDDSVRSCDGDGVLDDNETGRLVFTLTNRGFARLVAPTVRLRSPGGRLTFSANGVRTLGSLDPFASAEVSFEATLRGAQPVSTHDVVATVEDVALAGRLEIPIVTETLNWDLGPSNVDAMAATTSPWEAGGDAARDTREPWRYATVDGARAWVVRGNDRASDQWLVSPPLVVRPASELVLSFLHRFDEEPGYDGGVLELSSDDGTTWQDIGASLDVGYTGVAAALQRRAFTGRSPGWPALVRSTARLGTTYAGATVRVRLRVATDGVGAGQGWTVRRFEATGLSNQPFTGPAPDRATCGNRAPSLVVSPAVTTARAGERVTLVARASDPDSDPLVFRWRQVSGPAVELPAASAPEITFAAPLVSASDAIVVEVTANDGSEDVSATSRIEVQP